jgi:hypothetical protein
MKNILGTQENLTLYTKAAVITYQFIKNSDGYSYEQTFDENGNVLTYKNSDGASEVFVIPEFTMEQLVTMVGNFKLIK